MLWKCCTQYASKFGKFSSGHRTGKCQFSFQSQEWQCQRMFKLPHSCTHLTCSKVMLKVFQARLQQNANWELSDIQAAFRKGRGTRYQIANIHWNFEKAREFQKNIYFCFMNYIKAFNCVDHKNCGKFFKRWEQYHLNYLLRRLLSLLLKKQQLSMIYSFLCISLLFL